MTDYHVAALFIVGETDLALLRDQVGETLQAHFQKDASYHLRQVNCYRYDTRFRSLVDPAQNLHQPVVVVAEFNIAAEKCPDMEKALAHRLQERFLLPGPPHIESLIDTAREHDYVCEGKEVPAAYRQIVRRAPSFVR